MNARMIGLFSGFPDRRFPAVIAARLNAELSVRNSLVFISAWPDDFARNDADAAGMHSMFAEWNMGFRDFCVIDDRTENADAVRLIQEADCIFLMGGHATRQFNLICRKGIEGELQRSSAVILGVSAGSSNMARRALDIWESYEPYQGLGLTELTIKAHVNSADDPMLTTLQAISAAHGLPIYAMADDSAIFQKRDEISCIGTIRLINGSDVLPFRTE